MQAKNLDFQKKKIGALPIIETMIRRLNLRELLQARIGHERYELYHKDEQIKIFSDELDKIQKLVLKLLNIKLTDFC